LKFDWLGWALIESYYHLILKFIDWNIGFKSNYFYQFNLIEFKLSYLSILFTSIANFSLSSLLIVLIQIFHFIFQYSISFLLFHFSFHPFYFIFLIHSHSFSFLFSFNFHSFHPIFIIFISKNFIDNFEFDL
jgi:hypothetical protein